MKYNLRTAKYSYTGRCAATLKWEGNPQSLYLRGSWGSCVGVVNDQRCHVEVSNDYNDYSNESTTLARFDIALDHDDDPSFQRDAFIIYLMTNHADKLAECDISYWEDLEPIELPNLYSE